MPSTNNYDDEALARALQIEYEREYRRRSMQQHLNVSRATTNTNRTTMNHNDARNTRSTLPPPPMVVPSAPLADNYYDDDDINQPIYNSVGSHRGSASRLPVPQAESNFGGVEISDAAFASQLGLENSEEERLRNQRKQHLQQQRDSYRATSGSMNRGANNVTKETDYSYKHHSRNSSLSSQISPPNPKREAFVQPTSNTSMRQSRGIEKQQKRNNLSNNMSGLATAVTGTSTIYSDEEMARRLEQEMRDEELARQSFFEEQIRQSSIAAQNMSETSRRSARTSGRSSCRRCWSCLLMLALVGAAAALLLYFFVGADDVKNFIPDPDQFRQEDPFNSANKEDANLWRTKGNVGLELVVVNALDDEWHPFFLTAVDEWNSGSPDTLSLTIEDSTPDSTCNAIDGKLKVCNGNYGATNWRGINKILLENGWIYSSAARMNEYYVTDNDDDQRQYTMCHEIGHGFGLPHTDENFFNKDLGNCMDYTNNPEVNKQPAYANFKFLAQLYGTIDGSPVPTDDAVAVESGLNNTSAPVETNNGNKRFALRNLSMRGLRLLPPNIVAALANIDSNIDNGSYRSEKNGWRILHESPYGHAHEINLGGGFTVQVHALNA